MVSNRLDAIAFNVAILQSPSRGAGSGLPSARSDGSASACAGVQQPHSFPSLPPPIPENGMSLGFLCDGVLRSSSKASLVAATIRLRSFAGRLSQSGLVPGRNPKSGASASL